MPRPSIGEHAREILAEMGLSVAEIDIVLVEKAAVQGKTR